MATGAKDIVVAKDNAWILSNGVPIGSVYWLRGYAKWFIGSVVGWVSPEDAAFKQLVISTFQGKWLKLRQIQQASQNFGNYF